MPDRGEQYRHYKSSGGDDYTYEVIGCAQHTETGEMLVIYKALYKMDDGKCGTFARPLFMRDEVIEYNQQLVQRFIKI